VVRFTLTKNSTRGSPKRFLKPAKILSGEEFRHLYLAGSDGNGMQVLLRKDGELIYSISKLDEDFKLTEVGSVESSCSESGLNTGKTLSEKFYLGGKNATRREFIIKSPLRKPIALTKIKHTAKPQLTTPLKRLQTPILPNWAVRSLSIA
jgi:hypothetical protein